MYLLNIHQIFLDDLGIKSLTKSTGSTTVVMVYLTKLVKNTRREGKDQH